MLVWLLAIPALLGVILLIRGWRGRRIDDHPICRKCGYDLHGIASPAHCPECGRDLAVRRAVRIGHRRRRIGFILLGTITLAVALGFGGMLVWTHFSDFDWQPHKPLWLLKREAEGKNAGKAQAAVSEMVSRAAAGKLSRGQVDGLVNRALASQVDPNVAWFEYPADVLEAAWENGRVPDSVAIQYAQQALQGAVMLQARSRAQRGKNAYVAIRHQIAHAGAAPWSLRIEYDFTRATLDGVPLTDSDRGLTLFDIASGKSGARVAHFKVNAEPGPHMLAIDGMCRLFPHPYGTSMLANLSGTKPMAEWPLRIQKAIEVVEDDLPAVEAVSDPALGERIKACVKVNHLRIVRSTQPGVGGSSTSQIAIDRPPMDVAFDILLRAGGREWWIGSLVHPADMPRTPLVAGARPMYGAHPDLPVDAEQVELVLRGNAATAERNPEIAAYWAGEIVIGKFPIETSSASDFGGRVIIGPGSATAPPGATRGARP